VAHRDSANELCVGLMCHDETAKHNESWLNSSGVEDCPSERCRPICPRRPRCDGIAGDAGEEKNETQSAASDHRPFRLHTLTVDRIELAYSGEVCETSKFRSATRGTTLQRLCGLPRNLPCGSKLTYNLCTDYTPRLQRQGRSSFHTSGTVNISIRAEQ